MTTITRRRENASTAQPGPRGTAVLAALPANQYAVPAGYYMLFLVSDEGTPSVARWVRVQ